MNEQLDFTREYNTTTRKVLRSMQWVLIVATLVLGWFIESSAMIALFFFAVLWGFLIIPCYTCPNCGEIVRVPQYKNSEGKQFNILVSWGKIGLDGKCWHCGVILKKSKLKSNNLN